VSTTFGSGAYATPTSPTADQITETEQRAVAYSDFQKSFGNRQLGPITKTPGFNQNYGFSIGDTMLVGTKRLGFFGGLSYDHKYSFYEGEIGRVELPGLVAAGAKPNGKAPGKPTVVQKLKDVRGVEENSWGAVANVALELFEGHEVAFTYVYTQNAEDVARRKIGQASKVNAADGVDAYLNELHWTERNLTSYQFRGRHDLRGLLPLQFDWLHSIASTTQDEPDYRLFNFTRNTNSGALVVDASSGVPDPANGPTRYYRSLKEDNHTTKLDFTVPFELFNALESKLKFGSYVSESERDFRERGFTFKPSSSSFGGDPLTFPNRFLTDQQLGFGVTTNRDRRGNLRNLIYQNNTTVDDTLARSGLKGSQNIEALYLMGEVPLFSQLKLIGGARWERTELLVNSFSSLEGRGTNKIEQTDLLPAAGLVFEIVTNMNLRLNWGKTVARPTFREFSRLRSYDPTGDDLFIGNPRLKMSQIENYDARWEWFRRPGEVLSVGAFYKDILSPIERITVDAATLDRYSYTNFPKAKVFGFEIEARSSLDFLDVALSNFSVGINYAWIKSETENTKQIIQTKGERGVYEQKRPLFDQSPYVLNADISWSSASLGSSVTLSYNIAGERLYLVNNLGFDIYEQPAPQLDLVYSQRLNRHWKLKFSAKNLLDPDYKRIYGQSGDLTPERIYSTHTKGRTFGISLACEF
jgi:TonB-dependent receptor